MPSLLLDVPVTLICYNILAIAFNEIALNAFHFIIHMKLCLIFKHVCVFNSVAFLFDSNILKLFFNPVQTTPAYI